MGGGGRKVSSRTMGNGSTPRGTPSQGRVGPRIAHSSDLPRSVNITTPNSRSAPPSPPDMPTQKPSLLQGQTAKVLEEARIRTNDTKNAASKGAQGRKLRHN